MRKRQNEQGAAMMVTVVVVLILVGLSAAMMSEGVFRATNQSASIASEEAQLICDAGLERARRALLEFRNADKSAWNDVLAYNFLKETEAAAAAGAPLVPLLGDMSKVQAKDPKTGYPMVDKDGDPLYEKPVSLGWTTTKTDLLWSQFKADALDVKTKTPDFQNYNQVSTSNTDIPANSVPGYSELFCKLIPFGRGAYHIVLADNIDNHGNGVDDNGDGDIWDADDINGLEAAANLQSDVIDGDRQVFLVITAMLPDGTMRQNVVLVSFPQRYFVPSAAILTDGTIQMSGSFSVLGTQGVVMANEDVIGNGGANAVVSKSVNAAGSTSGFKMANTPAEGINSGVSPATIPTLDIPFYKSSEFELIDHVIVLAADGSAYKASTGVKVAVPFTSSVGKDGVRNWGVSGNKVTVPAAIYYVEGNFTMTGQGNAAPYEMSVIATHSISLGGNSAFTSYTYTDPKTGLDTPTNTLAVAGQDILLKGTGTTGYQFDGVAIANEQIKATGNYKMNGAIIGVNATDSAGSMISNTSAVEPDITVQGNPSITYNGLTTFVPPPAASVAVESVRRTR